MAGLVPAIHAFLAEGATWMPGMQTSLRSLHKFDSVPGMTETEMTTAADTVGKRRRR